MIFPLKALSAVTLIMINPNNHVFKEVDGREGGRRVGAVVPKILLFSGKKREESEENSGCK